jgi:hypothetical protein
MSQPRAHVQGPPRELSPERVMVVGLGGAGCRIAAQLLFDLARRIGEGSPETRFFTRTRDGRLAPRAVFIDPDPVAMAALRAWVERAGAFTVHPEAFYTGPHGASRSHARGAALGEAGVADRAQELVQRAVDTNPLGALVLVHALAGGSGAGLLGPICGRLQKSNPGLPVITASLLPDLDIDPSPLDVQNAAIGLTAVQRGPRMSLLFDNDAAAAHARATAFPSLNVPLARPLLALARALEAGSLQLQELVPPLGAPHAMWVTATLQATGRLDLPGLAARSAAAAAPWPRSQRPPGPARPAEASCFGRARSTQREPASRRGREPGGPRRARRRPQELRARSTRQKSAALRLRSPRSPRPRRLARQPRRRALRHPAPRRRLDEPAA